MLAMVFWVWRWGGSMMCELGQWEAAHPLSMSRVYREKLDPV
jgi:hypothetical protein